VKRGNPKEAIKAFKRGPTIYIQHITFKKNSINKNTTKRKHYKQTNDRSQNKYNTSKMINYMLKANFP